MLTGLLPYVGLLLATALVASLIALRRGAEQNGPTRLWPPTSAVTKTLWDPFEMWAFIILVTFAGLRSGVGTDFDLYVRRFDALDPNYLSWSLASSDQESGFALLGLAVKWLGGESTAIFVVCSALTVGSVLVAIRRASLDVATSLILYLLLAHYLFSMNVVRQGLAVAVNLVALTYLNGSRRKFWLLNLVASTIHVSAILAAILQYVLRSSALTRRTGLTLVVLATLGFGGIIWLPEAAESIGLLSGRYADYLSSSIEVRQAGVGTAVATIFRVVLLVISLNLPLPLKLRPIQVLLAVSIPLSLAGYVAVPLARMDAYFSIVAIILLPSQLAVARSEGRRVTVVSVLLVLLGVLYFFSYLVSFGGLVPYRASATW